MDGEGEGGQNPIPWPLEPLPTPPHPTPPSKKKTALDRVEIVISGGRFFGNFIVQFWWFYG